MYCSQCGKSIPDDSKFCPRCGAITIPESPEEQPSTPPPGDTIILDKKPPSVQDRGVPVPQGGGVTPPHPSSRSFPPYPQMVIIIWAAIVLIATGAVAWWPVAWSILSPLLWITAGLLILSAVVEGIPSRIFSLLALLGSIGLLYSIGILAIATNTTYWGNVTYYGWEVDTPFLVVASVGSIILLVLSGKRLFGKRGSLLGKLSAEAADPSTGVPGKLRTKVIATSVIAVVLVGIVIGFPLYSSFAVPKLPGVGEILPGMDRGPAPATFSTTVIPTQFPRTTNPASLATTPTRTAVVPATKSYSSPPNALFSTSTLSGNAPLTVYFSDDSTGFPTAWSWDYGDGNSASVQNPVHTYARAGTYSVRLSVTGPGGSGSSYPQQVMVYGTTPSTLVAAFSAIPASGVAPLAVTFTDTSSGSPSAWNWEFGDGGASTLASPVHTYMTPGQYTARLTVSSGSGPGSTAISPIMVSLAATPAVTTTAPAVVHTIDDISGTLSPARASFTFTPDLGPLPLVVRFQDISTGSPTSWHWDFGDGTTSTLKNPVHTYTKPGDFFILLSVTSATGSSQVEMGPVSVFYRL